MYHPSRRIRQIISLLLVTTSLFGSMSGVQAATGQTSKSDADSVSFVGIKKSRSANILDTFKEQQKDILFVNSPFTTDEEKGLFESETQMNNLGQIMARIEESKNSLKDQKQTITSRKYTLQSLIADLDESIALNTTKISDAEEAVRVANKSILLKLREIVALQNRIDSNKEAILSYLSYVYSKGNLMYGGDDSVDIIRTLVFTDGNVSDVLANYHFLTVLEVTGQNFLEERRTLLSEYYVESQKLKDEKVILTATKNSLIEYKATQESQKVYKEELLEKTRGQEALFNEYIADRQEKQNKIEERLAAASALYDGAFGTVAERSGCTISSDGRVIPKSLKQAPACQDLQSSYDSEKRLREYSVPDLPVNPLKWPVTPTYISSYFHDADYYESVGSSHEGIDIPVAQATEIRAPMAGYVYFINEPTVNGYGYLALKHAN